MSTFKGHITRYVEKPVLATCKDGSIDFPSMQSAARELECSMTTLRARIRDGLRIHGRWKVEFARE